MLMCCSYIFCSLLIGVRARHTEHLALWQLVVWKATFSFEKNTCKRWVYRQGTFASCYLFWGMLWFGVFPSLSSKRCVLGIKISPPRLMLDSATRACRANLMPGFTLALQPWAEFNGQPVIMSERKSMTAACPCSFSYMRGAHMLFRPFPSWGHGRIASVSLWF